jgi:hypothetical protein
MAGQNVPTTKRDMLPWARTHRDQWVENFAEIGLSEAQSVLFKGLVDQFVATAGAAETARQASLDATEADDNAYTAVRSMAGAFVRIIKGYAESTNNPEVYALAGIKANAGPGSLPAPVPPAQLSLSLNGDGSFQLKWKVTQPAGVTGVTYQVYRKLPGDAEAIFVGNSTKKSFKDATVPFGADGVTYLIQPVRGGVVGDISNQFTFQFGTGGGGGLADVKLAA